jgi:hypothetical protein
MPETRSHCLWLQPKNIYLLALLAARRSCPYPTLKTGNPSIRSLRNSTSRRGVASDTEGPLMLKQDPLVGAVRTPCHNILTKRRDTRSASLRNHRGGLARCSENNNIILPSDRRDGCAVRREGRHRVYKYGFRQVSDLSGNVCDVFFESVLIRALFLQKVPLLQILEQDNGAKALFIYPTKVSHYLPATLQEV